MSDAAAPNTDMSSPTLAHPRSEALAPLFVRLAWVALIVPGLLLGRAVDGRSAPVSATAQALWWLGWGVGLVAVLAWHPIGLVWLRIAAPAAAIVTIWCVVQTSGSEPVGLRVLAAIVATVAVGAVGWAETGHLCVNGQAYPNERRFLLRPAAPLLAALPIAGLVIGATAIAGPMLLAARQWLVGGLGLIAAVVTCRVLGKALYAQARRFVVFVPAGFVLHDEFVIRDPVLFGRRFIERIGPADSDSDSLDLTNGAAGLVLEALLTEKIEIVRVTSRRTSEVGSTARFLFVPTLPGRLIAEARSRRITA